jgi:cobaltochelatase CobN
MVLNIVSLPGVLSPELALEFRLALEKAGQKSLEEQVSQRESLLERLGDSPPNRDRSSSEEAQAAGQAGPEEEGSEMQSVKGLKMEKVTEGMAEKTELTSSGVEWMASIAVLALVGLFYVGLRRGKKPNNTDL